MSGCGKSGQACVCREQTRSSQGTFWGIHAVTVLTDILSSHATLIHGDGVAHEVANGQAELLELVGALLRTRLTVVSLGTPGQSNPHAAATVQTGEAELQLAAALGEAVSLWIVDTDA